MRYSRALLLTLKEAPTAADPKQVDRLPQARAAELIAKRVRELRAAAGTKAN
jgi:hypothetical protein